MNTILSAYLILGSYRATSDPLIGSDGASILERTPKNHASTDIPRNRDITFIDIP